MYLLSAYFRFPIVLWGTAALLPSLLWVASVVHADVRHHASGMMPLTDQDIRQVGGECDNVGPDGICAGHEK